MTPRTDFDKDLTHLQDELLLLGGMVEKAVARSMDALRRRDLEASRQVVKEDDIIDQKRFRPRGEMHRADSDSAASGGAT